MNRLLVVDTETSGLDPLVNGILALGAVVWEDGRIVDELQVFVSDQDCEVDPESMAINGIDLAWLASCGLPPSDAVDALELFMDKNGVKEGKMKQAKVVGHNLTFDIPFLKRLYRKADRSYDSSFSHRTIDTASVLGFLILAGALPPHVGGSSAAFDYFGIKVSMGERHTALGDAIATARLLTALLELLQGSEISEERSPSKRASVG